MHQSPIALALDYVENWTNVFKEFFRVLVQPGYFIFMRKRFLWSIIFWMITASVFAHPGIGIVMDNCGNVFYTDLKQVWKISPDGRKSVAVPNVHTHELYLDAENNLYGEHLWYEGGMTNKWRHYVWKLHADGKLEQVILPREGFVEDHKDYSFVRDRAGNMYWADPRAPAVIRKRTPDGAMTDFCKADFREVRWMTASAEGTIYLIDDGDLRRITPDGSDSTIARGLKEHALSPAWMGGLWLDSKGNVYVAVYGGGLNLVKKVSTNGKVTVTARSNAPWGPTGGLVAPNRDLWLLEYSTNNTARVRKIGGDGTEKIYW